jgi:hypothetical protein
MDSKTFVPLANALPCLEQVDVLMLPLAPTLGHYCPAPANLAGLVDAHGEVSCANVHAIDWHYQPHALRHMSMQVPLLPHCSRHGCRAPQGVVRARGVLWAALREVVLDVSEDDGPAGAGA